MGSFDIVNVTLSGVCPEQSVTETTTDMPTGVRVTSAAPTTIEIADFTEQCTGEVITVPVFNYGVTLSYNIIGLDGLVLSPTVIAGILSGSITMWDDHAIAAKSQHPGWAQS